MASISLWPYNEPCNLFAKRPSRGKMNNSVRRTGMRHEHTWDRWPHLSFQSVWWIYSTFYDWCRRWHGLYRLVVHNALRQIYLQPQNVWIHLALVPQINLVPFSFSWFVYFSQPPTLFSIFVVVGCWRERWFHHISDESLVKYTTSLHPCFLTFVHSYGKK